MSVNPTGLSSILLGPAATVGGFAAPLGPDARARSQAKRSLDTLAETLDLPQAVVDRRRKADDTLLQLQTAQRSMVSDRKAAAKQKLDQAKARLQMLRMFAGDPKTMARQAKQIAQEIRAAARAYGAAGATEAPAETTSSGTSPGGEAGAAAPGAAALPEDANGSGSQGEGTKKAAEPRAPAGEEPPPTAEEQRQQAGDAYRAAAHGIASRGAKSQAEREEIEQFKDAARLARQLLEEAARRLKQEEADPAEIEDLDKVSRSMTRAVEDLSAAEATGGVTGTFPLIDMVA